MKITLFTLIFAGLLLAAPDQRPAAEILVDLESRNYQTRRKAVLAVEERTEPGLLEKILEMATADPHANIRSYCADVLGTFSDDRIHPLLVAMTKEKWPGPRNSAYVALGRQGSPESYEILVKALDDPSSRGYAAKALGLLGDARAWDPILAVWRANPKDGYLVDMTPKALLALDRERAIKLFLDRFTRFKYGRHTLVHIFREQHTPAVREKMIGLIDAGDPDLRHAAIRVLGKAGNEQTVDQLIAAIGKREVDDVKLARALGDLGDQKAARAVCGLLAAARDPVAKVTLIGVLADLGEPHAIASIAAFLDDDAHARQPREISSIWGYPYNVQVHAAAVWAIRTLLYGEEPYERNSLVSFPNPPAVDPHGKEQVGLKAWWKEHEEDPGYRFE